jgi:diaminopropionate ammonia-lyase
VIDGYATLFAELDAAAPAREAAPAHGGAASAPGRARPFDTIFVPVGVGSLGAAAARYGAATGTAVVAVEPDVAACLTASLAAGAPTVVDTPGTAMAGLDCAEVSEAAWPTLLPGITGTVTVSDAQVAAAMRELAARGLAIGHSGAATLAALRVVELPVRLDRVVLIATEGPTDPEGYRAAIA